MFASEAMKEIQPTLPGLKKNSTPFLCLKKFNHPKCFQPHLQFIVRQFLAYNVFEWYPGTCRPYKSSMYVHSIRSQFVKGIVHLNIIFSYMKVNKICNLDHPVY